MHVYIIFAHPSKESFTCTVLEAFIGGLREAGHSWEIGDLYEMDFKADMNLDEYKRETGLDENAPLSDDVRKEHQKIKKAELEILGGMTAGDTGIRQRNLQRAYELGKTF